MAHNDNLHDLKHRINLFCKKLLPQKTSVGDVKFWKIIHDSTWGTQRFDKHEVEIINTPLFQRLRRLNQMGFVDYVYPSARHSRFEHSLGVTVLASKMVDAVLSKKDNTGLLDDNAKKSIRLSALLHDVGHCMFSHTSELIYGGYLEGYIEEEFNDSYKKPSPHEFFSYLIIKSDAFRSFFETVCDKYSLSFDLDEIALRIVGRAKNENDRYKTDFINGPVDADKLDYFHRDSQFSGIPIQLDIDRLLHEINISKISTEDMVRALTVSVSGITCIEQFIFNKMILYSTIYSHHKVEAIDCMLKGIFEYIMDKNIKLNIGGVEREIEYPDDFLYLTDFNLFALADSTNDCELRRLINNIQERKLLKRAFVISRKTLIKEQDETTHSCMQMANNLSNIIDNGDSSPEEKLAQIKESLKELHSSKAKGMSGIIKLLDHGKSKLDKHKYMRMLAKKIYDEAMTISEGKLKCQSYEIWIDMPKSPSSKEIQNMMVRTNKENKDNCKSIDKYFPFAQYEDLYENNRLNGHVFAPEDSIEFVSKAAKKVLEESLNIQFNKQAFHPVSRYSN